MIQAILVLVAVLATVVAKDYPTDKINVHLFSHTHDDPGWLKTVDQYYYGANTTIYHAGVKYILDTVISELVADPSRKFTYCEMSYFQRWYTDLPVSRRLVVKKLVANGQLTFSNGGWVMHDEATTHYVSMIDQTTLGHRFLKDEFGYTPRVGWQLDPFGHSATQANLLTYEAGFDGMFFGRIDWQDFMARRASSDLEVIWKSSKSNPASEVFAECFNYGYYPAPNICWDCGNEPIMDNPRLNDYNVPAMMDAFRSAIEDEASYTKGKHVSLRMGGDFMYENAHLFFSNIDKMIELVNQDGKYNMFYSTPEMYLDAKAQEGVQRSDKTGDFFPYSDCEHCFWSGYYSSRVTTKLLERRASSSAQVLKQLTTAHRATLPQTAPIGKNSMGSGESADLTDSDDSIVFHLNAAVGLFNHHDGVSGTAKQHVAYDYVQRIDKALTTGEARSAEIVRKLSSREGVVVPPLSVCRLANETVCEVTQSLRSEGDAGVVVLYNGLARATSQHVTVPLSAEAVQVGVTVTQLSSAGKVSPAYAEIVPSAPSPNADAAPYVLHFTAEQIPALATSVFELRVHSSPLAAKVLQAETWSAGHPLRISNDDVTLEFDRLSGRLQSATRTVGEESVSIELSNDMGYYTSFGSPGQTGYKHPVKDLRDHITKHLDPAHHVGLVSGQHSGAYIFRPVEAEQTATPIRDTEGGLGDALRSITVFRGREVSEVRQVFSSWASTTVSLHRGNPGINLEYEVGPIPVSDEMGKEVIYKLTSSIDSGDVFYTDSNGREFMQRTKNTHDYASVVYEPVAGNYYPISTAAYIVDKASGVQLSIVTDRSMGGASLEPGEHRYSL